VIAHSDSGFFSHLLPVSVLRGARQTVCDNGLLLQDPWVEGLKTVAETCDVTGLGEVVAIRVARGEPHLDPASALSSLGFACLRCGLWTLRPYSVAMGPFRFPIQMTVSFHCKMGEEKWAFSNRKRD